MAKLPRPTGKELIRLLEQHGYRVVRVRGSHHFLESVARRTCVRVHGHNAVKIGTLRSILRDIAWSPAEFEQCFRQ